MWAWKRKETPHLTTPQEHEADYKHALAEHNASLQRCLALRSRALEAGLEPYEIEVPLWMPVWVQFGGMIAGMKVTATDGPLTVLARPAKIGRYQVVFPTRFEEAA